ncbi:MAG: hypothetical protein JRJ83_13185 [Deltaproteobacteria bacterium]|nr:hypothetical protein [Deltaproteobacteria bacterium]
MKATSYRTETGRIAVRKQEARRWGRIAALALCLLAAGVCLPGLAGGADVPQRLKDILPGSSGSNPAAFVDVDGTVYFAADDGVHGLELWRSDGTDASTVMVKDINPTGSSSPSGFVNIAGTVYFAADNGVNGVELWKTDGTQSGTVMVKDLNPGQSASQPSSLADLNGTLFFAANDGTHGVELWKSDGTAAGTVLVKEIHPSGDSAPADLIVMNGMLFFTADDGKHGVELWKSDGTAAGTVMVKDIAYHGGESSSPVELTDVNGTLFFRADDQRTGLELWKSDGTESGTSQVEDINTGEGAGSSPANLTNLDGVLLFTADDGRNGVELWKSDGTGTGTVLVKDILEGTESSSPDNLVNHHGWLFFTADDGTNGRELWFNDGGASETSLLADINAGGSAAPGFLTPVGSRLYFSADDGVNGVEPWVLLVNTRPTISGIPNQSTFHDDPVSVSFTINDLETDPDSLTVTVTSGDQVLLPDANMVLGGNGANRTLTLTPATGQSGTVEVTVEVGDGETSTHVSFTVEWYAALVVAPTGGPGVDYTTLYEVFQDADDGDIIILKNGVYSGDENRDFELDGTRHLTIRSANGPENTIIDLLGSGPAFSFSGGDDSVIEGLTFRNGGATTGGAIYVETGDANSPTIKDCIFENNYAISTGGAIYLGVNVSGAHPVISNCRFFGNSADGQGGAIYARLAGGTVGNGYFEISDCVFERNAANEGGGVYTSLAEGTYPTNRSVIGGSRFYDNRAKEGGGVVLQSFAKISGSAFHENRATKGGAVKLNSSNIENSIFWKNEAVEWGGGRRVLQPFRYLPL